MKLAKRIGPHCEDVDVSVKTLGTSANTDMSVRQVWGDKGNPHPALETNKQKVAIFKLAKRIGPHCGYVDVSVT